MSNRRRQLALALALAAVGSPALSEPRSPGLRPDPASVEAGLWSEVDKAERHVRQSAELNTDPALNAYVREVACKVAAQYCPEMRVYVLDRPFMNASMAPNGYTEVWSGLLLRASNEAELAFVIGHETSHFAENHSIERLRATKTRANVGLALQVGVAVLGVAAASRADTYDEARNIMDSTNNLIDVVYLGVIASVFRFTREQEAEADRLGLQRATAAGYASSAAAQIWREMADETVSSDFERVRKADAKLSIFDSHPLTSARILALDAQAKASSTNGEIGRERYRAAIRPHLSAWLNDDLRRRDFGETLHILDRLASTNEDLGVVNFYRGEAYRLRRKDGDLALARKAYAAAAAYPDAPVATWRELGDLASREKDAAAASAAYEAYLAKAPNAEDVWLVRDALNSLGHGV